MSPILYTLTKMFGFMDTLILISEVATLILISEVATLILTSEVANLSVFYKITTN